MYRKSRMGSKIEPFTPISTFLKAEIVVVVVVVVVIVVVVMTTR